MCHDRGQRMGGLAQSNLPIAVAGVYLGEITCVANAGYSVTRAWCGVSRAFDLVVELFEINGELLLVCLLLVHDDNWVTPRTGFGDLLDDGIPDHVIQLGLHLVTVRMPDLAGMICSDRLSISSHSNFHRSTKHRLQHRVIKDVSEFS